MKVKQLALILGIAATGFVGSTGISAAEAATVTQTYTFNPAPEDVPYTWDFTFNSFDESLGTLTGVSVLENLNVTAAVNVYNSSSTSQSFTNATASVPVTLTGPDPSFTLSTTGITTGISGTANPSGVTTFPGATGSTQGSISDTNLSDYESGTVVAQDWSAVAGSGTFSGTGPNGTVFFSGTASAGGSITLTYTYTPATTSSVPEPTTIFGSIVALGLGVAARRMKARRSA